MRNHILRKIMFYLTTIYLISVSGLTIYQYHVQKKMDNRQIEAKLRYGAELVKFILPDGYMDKARDPSSVSYEENYQNTIILTDAALKGGYKYLYAMKNYKGNYYFIACSRNEAQAARGEIDPYWLRYHEVPQAVINAYKTGIPQFEIVEDEFGKFVSYFKLEHSPEGTPYISGADLDYDQLQNYQRQNSLKHFFQLIALLLIFIPVYYLIYRIQKVYLKQVSIGFEILDTTPTCILIASEDRRVVFANQALLAKLQRSKSDVEKSKVTDALFTDFPLFSLMEKCIAQKSTFEGDYPRFGADQKQYWEHSSIQSTTSIINNQKIYYAFCQDLTSYKNIEQSLAENNQILKAVTHSMHQLLSSHQPYTVFDGLCEDLCKNTQLSRIQIFGSEPLSSSLGIPASNAWNLISQWQKEERYPREKIIPVPVKAELYDWKVRLSEGNVLHGNSPEYPRELLEAIHLDYVVDLSIFPIIVNEELWGFICAMENCCESSSDRDIVQNGLQTLAHSIGAAINRYKMENELRIATNAKSSFLSSVSHEIRTPLNGILGMINLLKNTTLDEAQSEYITAMKASGNQLLSLISDVLDISRIEAGKFTLHKSPTNVKGIVQVAINIINYSINQKNLDLTIIYDNNLPDIVITDELRLKQILVNLLNNAVKFTSEGKITIFASLLDKEKLHFKISDTGIGMSPDQLEKLFQPFFQAGSFKQSNKGSGLGLAICRSLIEMMDGEISVESKPGLGTDISFHIKVVVVE
ncbi:MAG: ATP-binding protein [Candidatus Cloacimonetes bacterium]|nr:ATP-binding protein [Candidatus Cloacimonadota bacterium]